MLLSTCDRTHIKYFWNNHQPHCTCLFCPPCIICCHLRVGCACADNQGALFREQTDPFISLLRAQLRPVAHGSRPNHCFHTGLNQTLTFVQERIKINAAVWSKRCHNRRCDAYKWVLIVIHHKSPIIMGFLILNIHSGRSKCFYLFVIKCHSQTWTRWHIKITLV